MALGTVKLPTKMVETVAPPLNPLPLMVMVCRGTAVEGDKVIGILVRVMTAGVGMGLGNGMGVLVATGFGVGLGVRVGVGVTTMTLAVGIGCGV